jgi:hypothetical protein
VKEIEDQKQVGEPIDGNEELMQTVLESINIKKRASEGHYKKRKSNEDTPNKKQKNRAKLRKDENYE